jgi:hypothetical protein
VFCEAASRGAICSKGGETGKMQSSHLLLEEPIRLASILEPSKPVSVAEKKEIHLYLYLAHLKCILHRNEFSISFAYAAVLTQLQSFL